MSQGRGTKHIRLYPEIREQKDNLVDKDMWRTSLRVRMKGVVLFAVLAALWWCECGDALYFHIAETESKCFIEEVPGETMIVGG